MTKIKTAAVQVAYQETRNLDATWMMHTPKASSIRHCRIFARLSEGEITDILEQCSLKSFQKSAVLYRKGEVPGFVHIVLSGRVGLFSENGRERTAIEFFGPGEVLTLPAVILEKPYATSARMLEAGELLLWPAAHFRARIGCNAALAYGVSLVMADHWHLLVEQINDLKTLDANGRLSAFLLGLVPHAATRASVTLPISRGLIAARLGLSPQTLSRAFRALGPIGVNGSGRRITIDEPARLRDIVVNGRFSKPDAGRHSSARSAGSSNLVGWPDSRRSRTPG